MTRTDQTGDMPDGYIEENAPNQSTFNNVLQTISLLDRVADALRCTPGKPPPLDTEQQWFWTIAVHCHMDLQYKQGLSAMEGLVEEIRMAKEDGQSKENTGWIYTGT